MRYKLGRRYEDYRKNKLGTLTARTLCEHQDECTGCNGRLVFSDKKDYYFCGYSNGNIFTTEIKTEKENNMRQISRDLLAQTLERWHEKNPRRGENPECGYCEDNCINGDDDCRKCLCPKDICNNDNEVEDLCHVLVRLPKDVEEKEHTEVANKVYSRLAEEWQRLGYGDLPEFGGANEEKR